MDNLAIVINKKAKNAESLDPYLEALSDNNVNYQLFKVDPENLDQTIDQCTRDFKILMIGGGDGTIRSAAQLCVNTSIILGVLPLGTMNHFHKELHLPTTPEEVVQAVINQKTNMIDLAEVNGHVFVNNSSIGFYPRFVRKRERYSKYYNKWLSYIPSLIRVMKHHKTYTVTLKTKENPPLSLSTSFLMVSNNLYSFQFPLTVERESFKDGMLGFYYLKYGKMKLSKIFWSVISKKSYFKISKVTPPLEIIVHDDKKIIISLDGENIEVENHLKFKILPLALKLLTSTI